MSRDVSHLGEPPTIIRRTSSPLHLPANKREDASQIEEIRCVKYSQSEASDGVVMKLLKRYC
jgi:hypothetical protein